MAYEEQDIQLSDILGILQKRWKLMVFPSLIAAFLAACITLFLPKTYQSYSLMRIGFDGSQSIESIPSIKEIMMSFPMRTAIASKMARETDNDYIDTLESKLKYEDASGLLKIIGYSETPEDAAKLVHAVTDIVSGRHQNLFENAQLRKRALVKEIKDTIKPVPLSAGINDFRIQPTTIEIQPVSRNIPVKPQKRLIVMTVFGSVFFICFMISFYIDTRRNK